MSEKPESDDFDADDDDAPSTSEDIDVDNLMADIEARKKQVARAGEPAWRRLERIREERETAARLSDFDDYELDDGEAPRRRPRREH